MKLNINDFYLSEKDGDVCDVLKTGVKFFAFSKRCNGVISTINEGDDFEMIISFNLNKRLANEFAISIEDIELAKKLDVAEIFKNIIALDYLVATTSVFKKDKVYKECVDIIKENVDRLAKGRENKVSPEIVVGEKELEFAINMDKGYAYTRREQYRAQSDTIEYDL